MAKRGFFKYNYINDFRQPCLKNCVQDDFPIALLESAPDKALKIFKDHSMDFYRIFPTFIGFFDGSGECFRAVSGLVDHGPGLNVSFGSSPEAWALSPL